MSNITAAAEGAAMTAAMQIDAIQLKRRLAFETAYSEWLAARAAVCGAEQCDQPDE